MLTLIENALETFLKDDDGQPIVMLNLLRFRPDGGRGRYTDYLAVAGPIVARFGAEIVYVGTACRLCRQSLDRPGTRWLSSAILIVRLLPPWRWMPTIAPRQPRCARPRWPRPCCSRCRQPHPDRSGLRRRCRERVAGHDLRSRKRQRGEGCYRLEHRQPSNTMA